MNKFPSLHWKFRIKNDCGQFEQLPGGLYGVEFVDLGIVGLQFEYLEVSLPQIRLLNFHLEV